MDSFHVFLKTNSPRSPVAGGSHPTHQPRGFFHSTGSNKHCKQLLQRLTWRSSNLVLISSFASSSPPSRVILKIKDGCPRPRPKPDIVSDAEAFACFHPVTAEWFKAVFDAPTAPQRLGWPVIARGESALILAPTGTGKTLTAFLWCLDRLMLHRIAGRGRKQGCRIVYVSPLKALAVDVERNLRSPLAGIANMARRRGVPFHEPAISVRTGDTPQRERARFRRHPAEILITTPESLYLLLTSQAAEALRTVDTVIIDEIHALVPTKRGAHLALSLERLEALTKRRIQRIGLSATQRPLEEVARFLGGVELSSDADSQELRIS